jgi:hypothetical protein
LQWNGTSLGAFANRPGLRPVWSTQTDEVSMKKIISLALAAGLAVGVASVAEAREGCGPGFHRNYRGFCVPNRGHRVVVAPGVRLIIGNYYTGRGYWDGRRYWQHRRHWHNRWRYY